MKRPLIAAIFCLALLVPATQLSAQSDTMSHDKKTDSMKSGDTMSNDKMSDGKMSGDHLDDKDSKMANHKKGKKKHTDTMSSDTH